MAVQKQDDQHEHTFSRYVRIRDVVLKTCMGRWTMGRSGKRGSGISVLPARHNDDDLPLVTFNSSETYLVKHHCPVGLDFYSVATRSSLYFILPSPSFLASTVCFLLHSSSGHYCALFLINRTFYLHYCLSCNVTFHVFISLFPYLFIDIFDFFLIPCFL